MVYKVRCYQHSGMSCMFIKSENLSSEVKKQLKEMFGERICSVRRLSNPEKEYEKFNVAFA